MCRGVKNTASWTLTYAPCCKRISTTLKKSREILLNMSFKCTHMKSITISEWPGLKSLSSGPTRTSRWAATVAICSAVRAPYPTCWISAPPCSSAVTSSALPYNTETKFTTYHINFVVLTFLTWLIPSTHYLGLLTLDWPWMQPGAVQWIHSG